MGAVLASSAVSFALNAGCPWPIAIVGLIFFALGLGDDISKWRYGRGFGDLRSLVLASAGSVAGALVLVNAVEPVESSPFSLWHWVDPGIVGGLIVFVWAAVLLLTVSVGSGISDGFDGLTGGLAFIAGASIAGAAAMLHSGGSAAAGMAGASAGFLLFNLPSNWRPGSSSRRPARAYLGDGGALALGGLMVASSLSAGLDLLIPAIAGTLLLEGFSSAIQAKLMVPLFRRFEFLGGSDRATVHYAEFPLPFVATPLHHHLELIGMSRGRVIVVLYGVGISTAALALAAVAESTLAWTAAAYGGTAAILALLWFGSSMFRPAFLDVAETGQDSELLLCQGRPVRLLGVPLYAVVDRLAVSDDGGAHRLPPLRRKMNPVAARRIFNLALAEESDDGSNPGS